VTISEGCPNQDGSITAVAGFVLAGGRSSRMGKDKALVLLRGRPLLEHALEVLRRAGLSGLIAGERSPLAEFAPVLADSLPDKGPLGGICAAMAAAQAHWVVFIPVDQPLIPPSLITCLLEEARKARAAVTLPSLAGFAETFPAVLCRGSLPVLEQQLAIGSGGCFTAFLAAAEAVGQGPNLVPVERLIESGRVVHPHRIVVERWFLNLNDPNDLELAESCLPLEFA
jgi:molybdopterin-guanine dinucleotide biosynthesis protein A